MRTAHFTTNQIIIFLFLVIVSFLLKVIGKFLKLNNKIWTMAWDNEENIKNNNDKSHKLSIEVQFELGFQMKTTSFELCF